MSLQHRDFSFQGRTAPLVQLLRMEALAKQLQMPKLRRITSGTQTGENLAKRGRGVHFEETRLYQTGDDIRHIDWRVTARTGITHTKVFREEHERPVVFLIDLHPGMYFGTQGCYKSVLAAQSAAVLAFAAIHDGNPVGGMVLHQTLLRHAIHGKNQGALPLLHSLSLASETPTTTKPNPSQPIDTNPGWISLEQGLHQVRAMLKAGTLLVIISDFFALSVQSETLLTHMAYRHPIWLLQTLDPIEVAPPVAGRYGISDGTTHIWLNLHDSKQHDAYLQFCTENQAKLTHTARRLGLLKTTLYTHQPLRTQLTALTQYLSRL